jgi:hypothetical protein
MKEEIIKIMLGWIENNEPIETTSDKILDLFGVSTRTFKVGDNVKWRGMDLIVVELGVNEILIATSENADDENYNDWWVGTQYVC